MESVQEQIHKALRRNLDPDEAFIWLASPQRSLGMRIPARLIAIGEGDTVLEALLCEPVSVNLSSGR